MTSDLSIAVNGETVDAAEQDGYLVVSGKWAEGDTLALDLPFALVTEATPDRADLVSLKYGPYTMSVLSDTTDYLNVPAAETLEAEWTPVEGQEAALTHNWNGMTFRAHHASKGEPFHIYMTTEGAS